MCVRPEYPDSAQKDHIQGTVVVNAYITTRGCIASARVLRSVSLAVDFAALEAVTGWRFEPARLEGQPVAVTMTVTLNFKLQ